MKVTEFRKYVGREVAERTPEVSVVIPAYNVSDFIASALKSVFSQSFRDVEVVVVNDGSPDTRDLEAQIEPFLDRIVYIKQLNSGAAVARNTAIANSCGRVIAFLDGDDSWKPNYLAEQVAFLSSGGFDMAYCDADLVGTPALACRTFMDASPSHGPADVEGLLDLRCNVITSGTVVRREAVERAGGFEAGRVLSEDFHLWVRIAATGRIGYQRKSLLSYRVSDRGLSGDASNRILRAIDVFKRLSQLDDLTKEQKAIISRRLKGFEADLEVETGKRYLLNGDFAGARSAFARAYRNRRTLKMAGVWMLTRFAPALILKIYRLSDPSARRRADHGAVSPAVEPAAR